MNTKLLFKTLFLMVVLLFLVLMGMNNRGTVALDLPPVLPKTLKQPAAIMYFGFFAVGFLSGTMLMAGGGKKSGGAGKGDK